MVLSLIKRHFVPFVVAIICAIVLRTFITDYYPIKEVEIKGYVTQIDTLQANYSKGVKSEINFIGNLENKNLINILGSSELTSKSPYIPYTYLPSEFNKPVMAFGHAYHQSFSMFVELLAAQEHLENANICIMVSPSWFTSEGTNIEAFIEFVPTNFLKSIYFNKNIPLKFKKEIGLYFKEHIEEIDSPSDVMKEYIKYTNDKFWNSYIKPINFKVDKVRYNIRTNSHDKPIHLKSFSDKHFTLMESTTEAFIRKNNGNDIYVDQTYFDEYLNLKNKPYVQALVSKEEFINQREMNDFELLVEVLKLYKCNATFVIQPLNPYHYKRIELYKPTIEKIEKIIKKNHFAYLNMFVYTKKEYIPGTLNDIMHIGDFGWLEIDNFILKSYEK